MASSRPYGFGRLATALFITIVGLIIAGLCIRVAALDLATREGEPPLPLVANDPAVVLQRASDALIEQHGRLTPAMLAAVRHAALAAPMDARPYLILGHQQLLDREPARALATLQAGQRLDPRQPIIHILLLDRYLRGGAYAAAVPQMEVLARLVGATQGPIAAAFAGMLLTPSVRAPAERALRTNPTLEAAALTALARSDTAPATIFALASPAARAVAGRPDGWGVALVQRLVRQGRYRLAKIVWRHVFRLPDAPDGAIFNPGFQSLAATPPFNWDLLADSLGAADLRGGTLAVDYYGRDSGTLASQTLVLSPGRYRFAIEVEPGKTDVSSKLFWTMTCVAGGPTLLDLLVEPRAAARVLSGVAEVPTGCPAQRLELRGEAGDIPAPVNAAFRAPAIARVTVGA